MSCVVEEKKKKGKNEKETYYSVTKRHVECRKIKQKQKKRKRRFRKVNIQEHVISIIEV